MDIKNMDIKNTNALNMDVTDTGAVQGRDKRRRILLAAYAKLPAGTTAQHLYDNLVLVVIVDRQTGVIQRAEFSFVTEAARDFLTDLLVGYELGCGADELVSLVQEVYFGPLKKAIIAAIRTVAGQYNELRGI